MDWITDEIAIGNIDDALRTERLRTEGVTAVLALCDFPTFSPDSGFVWQRVVLFDGEGNSTADLHTAVHCLRTFVEAGHRVLVHCREGVSRAPFVTACHLASVDGDFARAMEQVSQRRLVANPHPGLIAMWPQLKASMKAGVINDYEQDRNQSGRVAQA